MALALRAFLIVRTSADSFSVSVCRDLEAIHQAWEVRPNRATDSALLHIGFDRPSSSSFEEVGRNHPGRMLFTRSAKYAMPPGYEATEHEVGRVEGFPVYLATVLWGYAVTQEELVPFGTLESTDSRATERQGSRQVSEPSAMDQLTTEMMASAVVHNDESYPQEESSLRSSMQDRAESFRLALLVGDEIDDPCAIARHVPPWLLPRPLASLALTPRTKNCLAHNNLNTVSDLASNSRHGLLQLRSFGERSVRDLCTSLFQAVEEGPVVLVKQEPVANAHEILEAVHPEGFIPEIEQFISVLSDRQQHVFVRRAGFRRRAETLQQIGSDLNISRERVRQIEDQVLRRMKRDGVLHSRLVSKLSSALEQREFPLPLRGVEGVDEWFAGIGNECDVVAYLLNALEPIAIRVVTIDGLDYLARFTQSQWEHALRQALQIVKLAAEADWPEDRCRGVVSSLIGSEGEEFRNLLWAKASELCHFVELDTGRRVVISQGRGAESAVEAVLAEADSPLHFTEIAKRASERLGRPVDIRRAHTAAANVGILLARGHYGLEKHIAVSAENLEDIREAAEVIVSSSAGRKQWHASEILAALVDEDAVSIDGVDAYVLDHALRESGRLQRLGRMMWTSDTEITNNEFDRINLRQAVISILESSGRPLATKEIKQSLVAVRGVGRFFQLFPGDPLIRVGPRLWGLNDRDTTIKRDVQGALMDEIVGILMRRNSGIHASEIESLNLIDRPDVSLSPLVLSLAADNPRLRVSTGQYLYLAEWGHPRRVPVTQALKQILSTTVRPLTFPELCHLVEVETQRKCSKALVSTSLQVIGAIYDSTSGSWRMDSTVSGCGDEDDEP